MNAPRLSPAAAYAAAAAIGAMLAACGAPPAKRFSEAEPLRTADIVHAPSYEIPATKVPPAPATATAPTAPPAPARTPPPASPPPGDPGAALAAARADAPNLASERPASALSPAPPPSRGQPGAAAAVAPKTGSAASVRPPAPLAPGRWAVQVGVFAVAANAERDRERVAARLASTDVAAAQSIVRVERIGNRSHVLVGDLPDREAAQALAAQLRRVLRQDVVVLRR